MVPFNFSQYCIERAELKRIMRGDSEVVLATGLRGGAQMTSALAG